ncbi:MAG: hypothetical protein AAGH15_10195 [Myxococcota bacterium]
MLHFPVPLGAEGVVPRDDWDTLGMRGTGSQTLELHDVFVPDAAIQLDRRAGEWHMAWSVVLRVAPPLYMAPYVGLTERACELARDAAKTKAGDPHAASLVGAMENELAAARLAWDAMVASVRNFDFAPELPAAERRLVHKTLAVRACRAAVDAAMVAAGGRAFFRALPLEACFRDVQGAHFHPLPEHRQVVFSGRLALGLDPITGAAR